MPYSPYPPYYGLANGSDSGALGDRLTKYRQPVFGGYADPGATVTLTDYFEGTNSVFETLTVDNDSRWYASPTVDLAEGHHVIIATSTLPTGEISEDSRFQLTIDATAPTSPSAEIQGLLPTMLTDQSSQRVSGEAEALATIDIYLTDESGQTAIGSTMADELGHWNADISVPDGHQALNFTATDKAGNVSVALVLELTVDTSAPIPPTLELHDVARTGPTGVRTTASTVLHLGGSSEAFSTVSFVARSSGLGVGMGTAIADLDGNWSGQLVALPLGSYELVASAVDQAGNSSASAPMLEVRLVAPAEPVTAQAAAVLSEASVGGQKLAGTAGPNTAVSIWESDRQIAQVQADRSGAWSFDGTGLAAGVHSLSAHVVGEGGDQSSSTIVDLNIPAPRFDLINNTSGQIVTAVGRDYTGPVTYLRSELGYQGPDNVVIGARLPSVFLYGGAGDDALQVAAGSNVLDGGTGSNFLVGSLGVDGGTDTFFVDCKDHRFTWDTIVNFHAGDDITLWNYDPVSDVVSWQENQGTAGYQGLTLTVSNAVTGLPSAKVTFAGLQHTTDQLSLDTGTVADRTYLLVHNL